MDTKTCGSHLGEREGVEHGRERARWAYRFRPSQRHPGGLGGAAAAVRTAGSHPAWLRLPLNTNRRETAAEIALIFGCVYFASDTPAAEKSWHDSTPAGLPGEKFGISVMQIGEPRRDFRLKKKKPGVFVRRRNKKWWRVFFKPESRLFLFSPQIFMSPVSAIQYSRGTAIGKFSDISPTTPRHTGGA